MRKRLIYRADDIGYTLAFDLGAFKAIDEGIVTAADVMFDSPHTVEALKWLKERPWISVGWHRHLWESPVLPPAQVPHMVDEEGRFRWRHRHAEYMAEVPYEEAYAEFMAEMKVCYDILGRYPDTASLRTADIPLEHAYKDVVDLLGIKCDLTGRRDGTKNPEFAHLNIGSWIVQADGTRNSSGKVDESVRSHGGGNYESYDLKYFKDYDAVKNLKSIKWDEDGQIWQTGGHPGYLDDHILAESRCNIHRCEELRGAISPEVKQWIIDEKIELVNSRDVIYGTSEYQDHLKEINSPLWIGNF